MSQPKPVPGASEPGAIPVRVRWGSLLLYVDRMNDGRWLATTPEIMTHGVGDTVEEAIEDFQSMMVDLFRELAASEGELAPHLKEELGRLRDLVAEPVLIRAE